MQKFYKNQTKFIFADFYINLIDVYGKQNAFCTRTDVMFKLQRYLLQSKNSFSMYLIRIFKKSRQPTKL